MMLGKNVSTGKPIEVPVAADGLTVPVSGTLTATIDESTLATSAKQDTGNTSLSSIDTKTAQWDATNGALPVVQKPLAVSTYAWTAKSTTALAASLIIKASAGVLRETSFRLDATAPTGTYYFQYFDSATLPADATTTTAATPTPIKIQHVLGRDDYLGDAFPDAGVAFAAGVVVCLSTTEFTKTIAGAYLSGTGTVK